MFTNLKIKTNSLESWQNEEIINLFSSKLQKGEIGIGYSLDENNNYSKIIFKIGPSLEPAPFSLCPVLFQYPIEKEIIPPPPPIVKYKMDSGIIYNEDKPTDSEKLLILRSNKDYKFIRVTTYLKEGSCDIQFYSNNEIYIPSITVLSDEIKTYNLEEQSNILLLGNFLGIKITNSQNAKDLIIQLDFKNITEE